MAGSYVATPMALMQPPAYLRPDVTPLSKTAASPASASTAALSGSLSEISPLSNSILESLPTASIGQGSQLSATKSNKQSQRDSAVASQLTKTKMCAFFERGKCASLNCKYAHSADELRTLPNLTKTKMCKAFMQGNCGYGGSCIYAHGDADLRVTRGIYKTQMCNFYERGHCRKGDRCNHAHGPADMKAHTEAPKAEDKENIKKAEPPQEAAKQQQHRLPLADLLLQPPSTSSVPTTAPPAVNLIPPPPLAPAPSYAAPVRTMPTPTKRVTDIFAMAPSPKPSTPVWGQYGLHSLLSPVPGQDPSPMWPTDPIDLLLVNTPDSVGYNQRYDKYGHYAHALGAAAVPYPPIAPPPPTWAATGADELEQAVWAAATGGPPSFAMQTPTSPPSLGAFGNLVDLDTSGNDDNVALDLNQRLASLDAACNQVSAEGDNHQVISLRHRI